MTAEGGFSQSMETNSGSPPASPGKRRSTLPTGQQLSSGSISPVNRPGTVPSRICLGGENWRRNEPTGRGGRSEFFMQEEWVKTSWKKGECREEIKLISETTGLAFDNARIVLRHRSEQLLAIVGRERRLSLSLVGQPAVAVKAVSRETAIIDIGEVQHSCRRGRGEGGGLRRTVRDGLNETGDFSRYVRGLCVLCNGENFDETLEVLVRAYSKAGEDGTITRDEIAAMLAKHVAYDHPEEDPTMEKERLYRWLKRRFIDLTKALSVTPEMSTGEGQQRGTAAAGTMAHRESDGVFISWEGARELLRHGPRSVEIPLAIDLPRLAKDLWAADLVDMDRTAAEIASLE